MLILVSNLQSERHRKSYETILVCGHIYVVGHPQNSQLISLPAQMSNQGCVNETSRSSAVDKSNCFSDFVVCASERDGNLNRF